MSIERIRCLGFFVAALLIVAIAENQAQTQTATGGEGAASTATAATSIPRPAVQAPKVTDWPVMTERRLGLLRDYARLHFGYDSIALADPKMIVVHYTASSSLDVSLASFKDDYLPASRTDIAGHGDVNVGIHYLIAKDGRIFRLQDEGIIGRHIIGFNHCSIGIEMVAADAKDLTAAQLEACAVLCVWIASRHPTIEFLIGHHEYARKDLPHFALYLEREKGYVPTVKIDPGQEFMTRLRAALLAKYSLKFKD